MGTPAPPTPLPPNGRSARKAYLRGIAFGSIPLIIFLIFGGIAGYLQRNGQNPYSYAGAAPFLLGLFLGALVWFSCSPGRSPVFSAGIRAHWDMAC